MDMERLALLFVSREIRQHAAVCSRRPANPYPGKDIGGFPLAADVLSIFRYGLAPARIEPHGGRPTIVRG